LIYTSSSSSSSSLSTSHFSSSSLNSSEAIDKILEYNGAEFQNLYDEYSAWAQDVEGDVVKPERPPAEFLDDDDEEDDE